MIHNIYSYGGGESLQAIFSGISMLFSNGVSKSIISLMSVVALTCAGVQTVMLGGSFKPQLQWAIRYMLIIGLLITPTTSVWIRDVVSGVARKIDNIPIGLAIPAGIISGVGLAITIEFESVFNTVDYLPYHKYGTVFGAQLMSEARNFKIQDPIFRENMESFIDNCVIYDVMIGNKYTVRDLRISEDVWSLISANSSNIKMINYRNNKGRIIDSCKNAAAALEKEWNKEYNLLESRFSFIRSFVSKNGSAGKASQLFSSNIEAVMSFYGSRQTAAKDVLKQLMTINAIADVPLSYGNVRAGQQQKSSWIIAGELAKQNLPIMHSIFEALIYGAFPLVFGLMFLPGGFRVAGTYFGMMLWVQLWPPLYAVLNLIVSVFNKSQVKDMIVSGINMENIVTIANSGSLAAACAGGLGMFIPVISYMIVKGGAGQFVHIAGQLTSAGQSAAMAASNEVTSGNRSFDNVSMSTSSYMNNSAFKTDLNSSIRAGHSEYSLADGMIVKEMPGGGIITQAGAGVTTSIGSKSFRHSDILSGQLHQQLSHEKSLLDSSAKEYSNSQQIVSRKASEFIARIAAGESSGQHYDYSKSGGRTNIVTDLVGKTKELHERYGYNWQQAAELSMNGGVSLKGGYSSGKEAGGGSKGLGWGMDAILGLSASGSARNYDEQSLGEQHNVSIRNDSTLNTEEVVRAAKSIQFAENQSNEKALVEQFTDSYEKMEQYREAVTLHQQNVDRFQGSLDRIESTSHSLDRDEYQSVQNFIASHPNEQGKDIGLVKASRIIEEGGEEFDNYYNNYISRKVSSTGYMKNPGYFEHNSNFRNMPLEDEIRKKASSMNDNNVSEIKNSYSSIIKRVDNEAVNMTEKEISANEWHLNQTRIYNKYKFDKLQNEVNHSENSNNKIRTYTNSGRKKKFVDAE